MQRTRPEYILMILLPLIAAVLAVRFSGIPLGQDGFYMFESALGSGLIAGCIALFYRYLKGKALWYVVILLPIVLSMLLYAFIPASISIFALVLPGIAFSLANLAVIKYLFYSGSLFRLRTLLVGLSGALILSGYLSLLCKQIYDALPQGFFNGAFINSLIIYVFIAFSMSVADLIILQLEVKRLKSEADPDHD